MKSSVEATALSPQVETFMEKKEKLFFVATEAGKEVYGDAVNMAIVQTLMMTFQLSGEKLSHFVCGRLLFVFISRYPLLLFAVSRCGESTRQQLKRIFGEHQNFDLRSLLAGSENTFEALDAATQINFGLAMNACKIHSCAFRQDLGKLMVSTKNAVVGAKDTIPFSLVFCGNALVNICRMKNYSLHPTDIQLLLALKNSITPSGENWIPVCLPKFNDQGFVYAYVSFLQSNLTLIMISLEKDGFDLASEYAAALFCQLKLQNFFEKLAPIPASYVAIDFFICFSQNQFVQSTNTSRYDDALEFSRLKRIVYSVDEFLTTSSQSVQSTEFETVFGIKVGEYKLIAACHPPNEEISNLVEGLSKFIRKNESSFFITRSAVF